MVAACHDGPVLLAELTATSEAVRATPARNEKIARLAETLRRTEPGEVAIAVAYLSGELRQRQIGVGYRSLRDLPAPAAQADARARRGRRGVRGDRRDGGPRARRRRAATRWPRSSRAPPSPSSASSSRC